MNAIHRWLCQSADWKRKLENTLLPWVLEGVNLGDDLLEVGPGPGLTTDLLRQRVARLTAIEIDPRLAHALQQRLADSNVRVIEGDASNMRLASKAFSSAIAMTMLHHVPSPMLQDKLFAEVHRVLRPGGVFAGTDNTGGPRFWLIHVGDTMVTVNPATLGHRLEAVGFGDISIDQLGQRFRFRAIRQPD